jgi:hypothetical protein
VRAVGQTASALLVLVGLGLPVQANAAVRDSDESSFGVQLLDAPVSRRDDPRAQRYIVDYLPPGTTIVRHMLVANNSDLPQHFDVYPAAATVQAERFEFGAGHAANELVGWVSLDHAELDLRPGEQTPVVVTIQVPPTASKGERYAVIWASTTSDHDSSTNVVQVHRVLVHHRPGPTRPRPAGASVDGY